MPKRQRSTACKCKSKTGRNELWTVCGINVLRREMKWKEGEDMTERDARDLVDWLDQAEEETKATIAEHERIDPFYDGVLSTVQTVREYIKKMRKVDEAEGEKQMEEIIADSKFEYIKEIKPFFWWTGSLSIEQAITHLTKRYDEEEAHNLLDEKLEFVSDYMRNNHGAVEQYGIYLLPEFMLGYDDIEIVIVAASENERATVVFSDIPVVKRGCGRI